MKTQKTTSKAVRNRNILLGGIILVLALAIIIPQFRSEPEPETAGMHYQRINDNIYIPEESPIRESIRIEAVTLDTIRSMVSAPASVEANPSKRANIFPPFGGRIVQLFVNMGQSVTTGQALFELYSPDIAEVQTEFISARSALTQAERDLRRKEDLHERGITPLRELEEARTEYEIAQSEMNGATMKMQILGISEDEMGKPLIVRSPINGRVVDLAVAPGEFIVEPEEPLMIIADLSNVWVSASIQEKDIRYVKPGTLAEARFPAWPGDVYEGTVLFVSDILDAETRTTRVRIEFENEDRKLKPGMFATVRLLSDPTPNLVIDPRAILQRRDYSYVYVEQAPYTFEKRRVVTGQMVDEKIVILSGLSEGEMVITQNAVMLP
ncbi:efflux RND transporter periplasmic adaptor subunit [Alkalitalea saponilacus]|uniref:Membrane fusion protein, cobalt-zinc-cadmium efflux system n=1 Tax=Alkalitalea saponilacus TaxID=889453 RepID=A0A1T5GVF3_9BACT|nr:efflux RND transporter periplasmic adaptor subunit [Alkalitalea saponilacus]ASB48178.1 efflux RND transporter periplasmic adaptor subunit [Alkalitalea saponilacus]SKC12358.1 membrane fusion protein, cobalt-zinc-cadmium efflux system [Alkalitalea saponilacus]